MTTFLCRNCNISFEDNQNIKKEYHDYIFGPCWKYIAHCPQCKGECSEKPEPKPGKSKQEMPVGCGTGACQGPACSLLQ